MHTVNCSSPTLGWRESKQLAYSIAKGALQTMTKNLADAFADQHVRFIHLVDELYERNVNLIVSAAALPEDLYAGTRLLVRFDRARSRLAEMQSHDYLAAEHLP